MPVIGYQDVNLDMKHIRRIVFYLIIVLILGGSATYTASASNNAPISLDSAAQAILQELARTKGIASDHLTVGYIEQWDLPLTGVSFAYAKVIDRATGKGYSLGLDKTGTFVDPEALQAAERAASVNIFGKLHPSLARYLSQVDAQSLVKVSIWLDLGEQDASIPRIDPAQAETMSSEELAQWQAKGMAHATEIHRAVEQPLIDFLPTVDGTLLSAADTAPLVFAELPAGAIPQVAALPYVDTIDLLVEGGPDQDKGEIEPPQGGIDMSIAGPTSKSNIVEARGFTGVGRIIAVVEGDSIEFANPYLVDGTCGPTGTCPAKAEHPTTVGGIMASTHSTYRGIAPGIGTGLLSANGSGWDLAAMQSATSWALNQGASVLNNSYYLEIDGVMHNSDRWMDYIVRNYYNLEVKSAGNRGEYEGNVTSPGLGYNTLTVGAANDNNTLTWDDDSMAAFSSYVEPAGREKPEVTAIGCTNYSLGWGIISTGMYSPWIYDQGCGTSYAAPIIAGGGALLINRSTGLDSWPESEKAILIATALHNIEGDSRLSEMDGAGAVDLAAADAVAANGWWTGLYITPARFDGSNNYSVMTVHLYAGERVRVALAYDSNPSADYTSDPLEGDLDLYLLDQSNNVVAYSTSVDSWEIIDYTVPASGNYTVRLHNFNGSFSGSESTYAGVAIWPGHYVLTPYEPQVRDTPPGAWNQDSGDDYRFTRGSFWNAVGIRSPFSSDYDIFLFNNSVYADPADHSWLEDSNTSYPVDFVVLDGNHAPSGNYYSTVSTFSGTGNYTIEQATHTSDLFEGIYGPYTLSASQVVRVWDDSVTNGLRKYYALRPTSGDADLGMALFASDSASPTSWYKGRSQSAVSADSAGAGGSEFMNYQSSVTDWFGLVVWNNSATVDTSYYLYVDSSAPTGSVLINGGATYANSTTVNLDLPASDPQTGVYQMRGSEDGSNWTAWVPYNNVTMWTFSAGDGLRTFYIQYKNNAEMISASYSDSIYLDTTAPTGSILINGGAIYTNSTAVNLTLSASDGGSGLYQMRFSNDNSSWSAWEAYGTSKSWTLVGGDGTKYVYVQYRDNAGNASGSFNDTIYLDTVAPSGSIVINGGAVYSNSIAVSLSLSATDGGSGVYQMRFSNDNSSWSAWEAYGTSKSWTLTSGDGTKTVYVQYRDNALNVSSSFSDTIILDMTAPSGTIMINGGAAYTNSTSVSLSLSASDGGSGVYQMRFSNDNSSWSAWEAYGTSKSWTLTSGDGTKTVYVQYRDNALNVSSSFSDTIILDMTAPSGTIMINGGAAYTNSTSVSLSLSASDGLSGVYQMRFSNDNATWSSWEAYGTSKNWTLASGDGTKTVYVQFSDNAGNISSSFNDTIYLDTTAPSGSILINSGAAYTNSTAVNLTLSASDSGSGVYQMRFSNDNSSWSAWEAYATSKSWTLTSGDGTKTVYVQYSDNLGNVSGSFNDSIYLDTVAPSGSIVINAGAVYANSTAVNLTLSASDVGSGVYQMHFSNDNSSWSSWESYSTSKSWTLASGDGTKTVYVQYRDNALNVSNSFSDTIILDTLAPSGTILINGGATYTNSTAVNLTLSASDGGSGLYQMRFSNDNSSWSSWEAYGTSKSWTLSSGDGTKTVYVQYRDNAGNISGSFNDTIILDATAPSGTILINGGATYTNSTAVNLTLSASDGGSGLYQMRFSNDNSTWSSWEAYGTSKSWTLTGGDGTKTVYVQYSDNAGNISGSFNDTIILDATAPSGSILINGGVAYTTSTAVNLTLSASDGGSSVYQMRFSNDNATWSSWEAYGTSKSWTLTGGDGTKTVYVQYSDIAGNISGSFSDSIILDTTAPSGSILINGGAAYTTSTAVNLTLSASDGGSGVYQMRFSNDNATWSSWEAYSTSKNWTLTDGDGTKLVYVQYSDNAGNISASFSDTIILDATAPGGTIMINGGATYAGSPDVSLTLFASDSGSGVYQMRFSNDNATWSSWEPYGTSKSWTLTGGDGTKTVYVQYSDIAGNISGSFSDSIILDTIPPSGTILINGGAAYSNSTIVTLTLSASDAGSGVDQMRFSNDNVTWSDWEAYGTTKSWIMISGDGTKTVYVQFKDLVGFISPSFSDTILLDTIAPTGVILVNGDAQYTNSTAVTLNLSASDTGSGVYQMRFSNDGLTWDDWETYASTKSWTLDSGDGVKMVFVQYRDNALNASVSFSDSIILDTLAPTGLILINNGADTTTSINVSLTLSAVDGGSGVSQMRFSNDGIIWSSWEAFNTVKAWTLNIGNGLKTVYVQFRDNAGNISISFTDTIILDAPLIKSIYVPLIQK